MPHPPDIPALLGRIGLGDRVAFRSLYEATASRLMAVAMRVLQNQAQAEDVLQEVFVDLWRRAGSGQLRGDFTLPWLCVVTRNRAVDLLRRKRPEQPLQWQDAEGEEHSHDVAAPDADPLSALVSDEEDRHLQHCLGTLEDGPQRAMRLAYVHGLTQAELAQVLDRPLGTVKAWMRRSLTRLKQCLEGIQ